jgi:hypothetical protein
VAAPLAINATEAKIRVMPKILMGTHPWLTATGFTQAIFPLSGSTTKIQRLLEVQRLTAP